LILVIGIMATLAEPLKSKPSFKNKPYFKNGNYFSQKAYVRGRRSPVARPPKFKGSVYINCSFSYSKSRSCRPAFSRGRRSVEASCYDDATAAGINASAFHLDVAHGIHSMTVEDIKYYFDSSIPDQMSIPTVNFNLSGQHVLLSPPLGSEFSTPGMRLFDLVLSNDDGKDHFMVQGLSRMEKIAHGMHMLELWHKTSKVYEQIKANLPHEKICSCLTDEDGNGILAALEDISIYLRKFSGEEEMRNNQIEEDPSSNEVDNDAGRVTENKEEEAGALPELKDAESWKIWKAMLKDSMIDEKGIYHLAMYLYCKIATVAQI